jgi:hypothetical protein
VYKDQWITIANSTDQSPSEPTGRSNGQEMFSHYLYASFNIMLAKPPTLVPVLGQTHIYVPYVFLRFILILFCKLHLRFQNDTVPSTFPRKILYTFIPSSMKFVLLGLFPWQYTYFLKCIHCEAYHGALFSDLLLLLSFSFIKLSLAPYSQILPVSSAFIPLMTKRICWYKTSVWTAR